jgi:hypothetical protein
MDRLDGNAIAGPLFDVLGWDLTTKSGTCAHCGTASRLAEAVVCLPAPGIVARCPHCDGVLMVVVDRRGTACADLSGLATLEEVSER